MGYSEKIQHLFNLRQEEVWSVSMLILYSFFQTMALALFFTTASAIFLTEYPVSSLPYVYLVTAVLYLVLNAIYVRLNSRTPEQRLMLAEVLVLLLMILLFRLGLMQFNAAWLAFALIVWHRVMSSYLLAGFNRLSLLLFDVRQSKRLFGLITSAETPANGLGYLLASLLAPRIGTANLLWVSAAALLFALIFLTLITRRRREVTVDKQEPTWAEGDELIKTSFFSKLKKNEFIFALSFSCFLAVIAFFLIEFAFLSRVNEKFSNQTDITFYLGLILGTGQVLAFFIKTMFYSRILRRFGIRLALFALPLALASITLVSLMSSLLSENTIVLAGIWVGIMLVNDTLRSALYNNTFVSLLQALQKKAKLAGLDILGNVEALAIGVSGLLLSFFGLLQGLTLYHFSFLLLIVLLAWGYSLRKLNRTYISALEKALKKRILEGKVLQLEDSETISLLRDKLNSQYPGEVLYALDILCRTQSVDKVSLLSKLLVHPYPEVRQEVLKQIRRMKLKGLMSQLMERIKYEQALDIKKQAIQLYCYLGEDEVVDEISPLLDDQEAQVQTGALVGLICYGGINGVIIAGQRLNEYIYAEEADKRVFAAQVVGEVGIRHFYHPLLRLLHDDVLPVRRAALRASGTINHPKLYPALLQAISSPQVFEVAVSALIEAGEGVITHFEDEFNKTDYNPVRLRRLVHICGKVGGEKAVSILKDRLYYKNIEVRNQVLNSLTICGYRPDAAEREKVFQTLQAELSDASWFVNCQDVLMSYAVKEEWEEYRLLFYAIKTELHHLKRRLLFLLSYLYEANDVLYVWESIQMGEREKKAKALEVLDVLIPKEISSVMLPLLEDYPVSQLLKILNARYPHEKRDILYYLYKLIDRQEVPVVNIWTQTVSIYVAGNLRLSSLQPVIERAATHPNVLVSETAEWVLQERLQLIPAPERPPAFITEHDFAPKTTLMKSNLLAIEKVMALKTTKIFSETSEDLLVNIAAILREERIKAGEQIVKKGEIGTCMYIIYEGKVKVHDGEHLLEELRERNFFGELSLLDAEPRSASVSALEDSLLLRLDQHAFYEIMADRQEVTREIMKILCRRLRQQNLLVAEIKGKLHTSDKKEE
ncbi:MAG: MFS transporter [Cyclobacteriaceae bacterium]